jgi:hypothetical protein
MRRAASIEYEAASDSPLGFGGFGDIGSSLTFELDLKVIAPTSKEAGAIKVAVSNYVSERGLEPLPS